MAKTDGGKKQFKEAFKKVAEAVKELEIDSLPEIGELVRSRIVAKARTGQTMASGTEAPHQPLSPEYKKQRKIRQLKGDFTLDPTFFKPNKSNLTLTGIYLDSIEVLKMDKKKGELTIGPNSEQHGQDKFTNQKLAKWLADMGRSIFGIDATTKARINSILKRDIRSRIKKNLLK